MRRRQRWSTIDEDANMPPRPTTSAGNKSRPNGSRAERPSASHPRHKRSARTAVSGSTCPRSIADSRRCTHSKCAGQVRQYHGVVTGTRRHYPMEVCARTRAPCTALRADEMERRGKITSRTCQCQACPRDIVNRSDSPGVLVTVEAETAASLLCP